MNLEELRVEIDAVDRELAALLTRRMELCSQVAQVKAREGLPLYHPDREAQVIAKVQGLTRPEYAEHLGRVWQKIMEESCALQQKLL